LVLIHAGTVLWYYITGFVFPHCHQSVQGPTGHTYYLSIFRRIFVVVLRFGVFT